MDQLWHILMLSLAMFIGSYISGMAPLAFKLQKDQINQLNVAGSGLLVGTALSVIIPEGVSALYSSQNHEDAHAEHHEYADFGDVSDHEDHDHEHKHDQVHQYVGLALLTGFLLMLMIDNIGGEHGHSHGADVNGHGSTLVAEKNIESGETERTISDSKATTATVGLVVHAAADGLALGAAGASKHSSLQIIVFLAIMLHKAPASFGLVSFLLSKNVERHKIKKNLAIFAGAAPFTAITSFFLMSNLTEVIPGGTGTAMLFSAGTFLYVATVHVLPEVGKLDKKKLFLMVSMSVLPLLLSLGHSH